MADLEFDPRNSEHLTQAWLFVEHFNAEVAEKIKRGKIIADSSDQTGDLQTLLLAERNHLSKKGAAWSTHSTVLSTAKATGFTATPSPPVIDAVIGSLLLPAQVEHLPDGRRKLKGRSNLPKTTFPDRLKETFWIYPVDDGLSFASREVSPGCVARQRDTWGLYWEEAFDPILVIQNLIMTVIRTNDVENANFYLQRWLRRAFDIHYDDLTKYSLAEVAKRVNELFYASPIPSRDEIHVARSATIGFPLLVQQIRAIFQKAGSPRGDDRRLALGIYLFLRFCRVFRCRYFWRDAEDPENERRPAGSVQETQCLSALRAVEYSYLLARMFGAITDIPGLTFVFRGGVLPRPESGRTMLVLGPPGAGKTVFALQKMVSIASRGGLAVYFSFEESYELIHDRLVTFGFKDLSKFDVRQAGADAGDLIKSFHQAYPHQGLLLFYHREKGESFDPTRVIEQLATAAGNWRWRALAIDSINAVEIKAEEGDAVPALRSPLNHLINKIEENRFLGVVLGEKDRADYESLPYLADTVVELGFYESKRLRWIEVSKCRSQNFHPGRHPCRIAEGKGLRIYPSLPAIQSSLRRRVNSTLSAHRVLKLDNDVKVNDDKVVKIHEKASILLCGSENTGKTWYALQLAQAPLEWYDGLDPLSSATPAPAHRTQYALEEPSSVLVVSFRTTERRFHQNIKASSFHQWWTRLKYQKTRWYSPGENVGPEQVVADVWHSIKESRRQGVPLQRIVFDELESAENVLPVLQRESLFWATLLQLVSTEAVTAIFVVGGKGYRKSRAFTELKLGVDYILELRTGGSVNLQKRPELIGVEATEPAKDGPPGSERIDHRQLDE
jgi:KaiC/GvpD/RAD55 family RecA-like ATPase